MTSDQAMRASDRRDRERAAEVPCGAYAAGRLDLEEFHDRAGAAYSAKTWGELRDLTADLPAGQVLGQAEHDADSRAAPARPGHAPQRPFAFIWVMAVIWLAIGRRCRTPPSPAARRPGRRRPLGGGAHEHSNDPGSESNWQGTSRFPGITVGPASRDRPPASGRPAAIFRPGPVAAQACWAETITGGDSADLSLMVAGTPGSASVPLSSPARMPAVNSIPLGASDECQPASWLGSQAASGASDTLVP